MKTTIKYGKQDISLINSTDPLVPTEAIKVSISTQDKTALAIAINKNLSCLLIGETGTGKTSIIKEIAFLRQQPYVRVNMTGFTDPDQLIGTKSVKEGATYFENGIITDAMKRGAILVIDEVNASTPDCLFILHGLLDEDRRITLPNGDVIEPHEDFRVFATCNPDYEGTKAMNKAFLDRFPIIISVDTLTAVKEIKLLQERTDIDEKTANGLVTTATTARKEYAEGKLSTFISTRGLLATATLIKNGMDIRHAYQTAIMQKTNDRQEQKVLLDYFLAVFKLAEGTDDLDIPTVTTKRELESLTRIANEAQSLISETKDQKQKAVIELAEAQRVITTMESKTKTLDQEIKEKNEKLQETERQLETYKRLDEIIKQASKNSEKTEVTQ